MPNSLKSMCLGNFIHPNRVNDTSLLKSGRFLPRVMDVFSEQLFEGKAAVLRDPFQEKFEKS